MKNDGFTLIELLLVLVIVATITASTSIVFSQLTEKNAEEELKTTYISIQRAAKTFVDLNDNWSKDFYDKEDINITLSVLKNSEYIRQDLKNPVTNEKIEESYIVRMCIANDDPDNSNKSEYRYIDTCIMGLEEEEKICVSNSQGISENCCSGCNNN